MNAFSIQKDISIIPQLPYSQDPSSYDIVLFFRLKIQPKVHQFGTLDKIQKAITDQLKVILVDEWRQRILHWCVASEDYYFKGGKY